ncbi:MAG TPA: hypothetical protein VFM18_09090 [Methanosarcina sp.]|nr:hypothetical protein [Methanosarcina sp.]
MSMFEEFEPAKMTKNGRPYQFAIKCDGCGSFETEAYRAKDDDSIFHIFCEECGHSATIRIPGV